MKGGEDRPDNCPPCPVCEERMKEPKQTGLFANFFPPTSDEFSLLNLFISIPFLIGGKVNASFKSLSLIQ